MRLLVVSCAPVVSSFTLSLACLLLTAITVHDTCSHGGSFQLRPLVTLRSAPFLPLCLRPPPLLSVFHTQSHTVTLLLWSCLCLCLYPPHLLTLFGCFFSWPLVSVCPPVWWVYSGGTWHLALLEMTHLMSHLINISSFPLLFRPLIVFDSVPFKPMLRALFTSCPTCCVGTAVFRRYLGFFGQPKLVGWLSVPLKFPCPASQGRHQRIT